MGTRCRSQSHPVGWREQGNVSDLEFGCIMLSSDPAPSCGNACWHHELLAQVWLAHMPHPSAWCSGQSCGTLQEEEEVDQRNGKPGLELTVDTPASQKLVWVLSDTCGILLSRFSDLISIVFSESPLALWHLGVAPCLCLLISIRHECII